MKKIIYLCGILFLSIVIILNVLYTATMDTFEHITIHFNSLFYVSGLLLGGVLLFFMVKFLNHYLYNDDLVDKTKHRKILLISASVLYALFAIIWTIAVRPGIVADQIHAANLAQTFYRGNLEEFLPNVTYAGIPLSQYIEGYHQQISLAFVFNIFFRIIHFDEVGALRAFNVIGLFLMIFALYKIFQQFSKKYKTNKVLFFILILTFISLPMLCTFIYGDIPSLAFCLFSVYFAMLYCETKEFKNIVFSAIFMSVAYMLRMNSLIFIIATTIYLLLYLWKERAEKTCKENIVKLLIILMYIGISIVPSSLVQAYYLHKYNLDAGKGYPSISYFLMAMEESPRANGWYNEAIGEPALKDPNGVKEEYLQKLKERVNYFVQNPVYTFKFYTSKLASMWSENTYSAVWSNLTKENDPLENMIPLLTFYQKLMLIVICLCSLFVLIQNRKNLSLELLFLLTIFIGGFAFHILWEAKSRYILPYIVVLIPTASIQFNVTKRRTSSIKK